TDAQRLADKVVVYLVPIVLVVALGCFGYWVIEGDLQLGIRASVAVLVVACPCAMGLATPTAVMVGSGRAAREGILIKDARFLEVAARVATVVLDKTGTITQGKHAVVDLIPVTESLTMRKIARDELLATAAAAEQLSRHPIAISVVEAAKEKGLQPPTARDLQVIAGKGIQAECRAGKILIGNEVLMAEHGVDITLLRGRINTVRAAGQTPLIVGLGQQALGVIAMADVVPEISIEAIWKLKELGLRLFMVTGDHRLTAEAVARQIGIHQVVAQVLPHEKRAVVLQLQEEGVTLAMVGDGINDAAALATADLGIAIGTGADIAVETADIVISGNDLRDVHKTIVISRATLRTIRQNLFWSFAYNALLIPLATTGLVPPTMAAAAMALSSISVVGNSLWLRNKKLAS
ncbi:MAG: heavy metal translocating P-type ATPase, partial [Planctomycetales bacterium]